MFGSIATQEVVVPPLDTVVKPRLKSISLREPVAADGPAMYELARTVGLDENSPYAYVMWAEFFSRTSVVATDGDDDVVGFITGFAVDGQPATVFVWQIGVASEAHGRGIAGSMLDELVERTGAQYVEATVTPSNVASSTLFTRFGERHGAPVDEQSLFAAELLGADHEAENRFRIGPLG